MEELPSQVDAGWNDEFARALGKQRSRVEEFVNSRRRQLADVEMELAERIGRLADEAEAALAQAQATPAVDHPAVQDELRRLDALKAELKQLHEAFDQAQQQAQQQQRMLAVQLQEQQGQLGQRRRELEQAEAALRQEQRELSLVREELDESRQELTRSREKLRQKLAQLEQDREQLDEEATRTKAQRRRLASEFWTQRASRRQEEMSPARLQEQLAELEEQRRAIADREQALSADQQLLCQTRDLTEREQQELRHLNERLTQRERAIEATLADHARRQATLADEQAAFARSVEHNLRQRQRLAAAVKRRRDALRAELRQLQRRLEEAELRHGEDLSAAREQAARERRESAEQGGALASELEQLQQDLAAANLAAEEKSVALAAACEAADQARRRGDEFKTRCEALEAQAVSGTAAEETARHQRLEIARQNQQLDDAHGSVEQLRRDLETQRAKAGRLESELAAKIVAASAAEDYKLQLAEREGELREVRGDAQRLVERIAAFESHIAERDEAIARLAETQRLAEERLAARTTEAEQRRQESERQAEELQAIRETLQTAQAGASAAETLQRTSARLSSELQTARQELEAAQAECSTSEAHRQAFERLSHEAHELRTARAAAQRELEEVRDQAKRRGDELSAAQSALAAAEQHVERLRGVEADSAIHACELAGELGSAQDKVTVLEVKLSEQRAAAERLQESLADGSSAMAAAEQRLTELQAERDELETKLAQAEQAAAAGAGKANETQLRDADKRYQMAMDDLRQEKARNAELNKKLAQGGGSRSGSSSTGESMDWESQKRRLLASLEADFDESDPHQAGEKLKFEEVVRDTGRIVAEKEQEVAELRQLLEQQTGNWGSMAVGAQAIAELLDNDAIVQQERENLQRLQDEWREKLRQAEIDVSLERAKIARERAEVDEKLRTFPQAQERREEAKADKNAGDKSKGKPGQNRWLKALGLNNPES